MRKAEIPAYPDQIPESEAHLAQRGGGCATSRILVLGEDTRAFLAAIRSLGRAGLEVHVAWCPWNSAALKSKYIRQVHPLPAFRSDDRSWLDAFNCLCDEYQFELILPCTDGTMLPLHLHRGELTLRERICVPAEPAYEAFCNKDATYSLASRLGVPVPPQTRANTIAGLRAVAEGFGLPLVVKPKTSASAGNPLARQAVRKIRRLEDLDRCAGSLLESGEVLLQQNFVGIGVGVGVLCRNGRILTAFQHERVHEPRGGGGSSYRKSVPLDPGMLDAARRLMEEVSYTGVAMVEFKYNPRTKKWILIEVNARFWGSLPLPIAAGLDFPRYLYEMLCRGRTEFPQQYRTNLYARHWSSDLEWMLGNLEADRRDPDVMCRPWLKVAGEVFNLLLLRERADTLAWDDPRPAVSDLGSFVQPKMFSLAKRMGFARRMRRRKALRAVREARRVLFVCHGNICRSPFAAAVLRQKAPEGVIVSSSGCFPKAGRRPPEAAIRAARQFGVDLAAHRSDVLTQQQVDGADLILVFDRRNIDELEAFFTGVRGKTHYLGDLDLEPEIEIADPYGAEPEVFQRCYRRISRIVGTTWNCVSRSE